MKANKRHRLIFEGPDRCGKSNISSALSELIDVPAYKSGREHSLFNVPNAQYNVLKWAVYEQIKMIEICDASIIFDRFFPSEFVYSRVYNRPSDDELVFEYDGWWDRLDGKIIFCEKQCAGLNWDDEIISKNRYDEIKENYA